MEFPAEGWEEICYVFHSQMLPTNEPLSLQKLQGLSFKAHSFEVYNTIWKADPYTIREKVKGRLISVSPSPGVGLDWKIAKNDIPGDWRRIGGKTVHSEPMVCIKDIKEPLESCSKGFKDVCYPHATFNLEGKMLMDNCVKLWTRGIFLHVKISRP